MKPFPFKKEEWQYVQELAREVTNATLMDDVVLREVHFGNLQVYLHTLRGRYGNHPILIETEADFCDQPNAQVAGYAEAIQVAEAEHLGTLSIRLSLARLLIEEFVDCESAKTELLRCESELLCADNSDTENWHELMRRCSYHC